MIGLPPKIPTMIRPNIKHELPVAEKSMAQPSSCKGKEVVTKSSIKNEVDIDDKSLVNMMDDSVSDAKRREKRLLANRLSAQRYRARKIQYVNGLKTKAKALEDEIKSLDPQLRYHDNQRSILTAENSTIRERMAVLIHQKVYKDAEFEALKNESEMLHQFILLQQQQLQEQQLQQQQFMMGMGWELQGQAANMNIPSNSISDMVQF
ncbi:hypothetical protein MRB53_000638 [Persea americana]|uniref:Uncharacterized protein n=1 Tax=Persea americana TaxID=3435 RepID=A0ACC2MQB9_PERAE|nr:hypothetical protein MRB53_000638 [Persea americana]